MGVVQLLHLHPLTLEDILTQEPREKLELFPKLGYYLVVFRAIESEKSRNRRRLMGTLTSHDGRDELRDEGILEAVTVYLVVFREGICSVSGNTAVPNQTLNSLSSISQTSLVCFDLVDHIHRETERYIPDHTDAIRSKIISLSTSATITMSAGWSSFYM
jgi:Mg2+ and Co2+ transporter CorA